MDTKIISGSERKGHKRKLADTSLGLVAADGPNNHLILDVRNQIEVLKGCTSWREADRVAARRAAHSLAELAKHGKDSKRKYMEFYCFFSGFGLRTLRFANFFVCPVGAYLYSWSYDNGKSRA